MVSANLKTRKSNIPAKPRRGSSEPVKGSEVTLGVTGLVGPRCATKSRRKTHRSEWTGSVPALNAVLKEMNAAKVDLPVLLYMGSLSQGHAN